MMGKHQIFGVLISTSFLVALQVVRISTTASCDGIPIGNVGNSLPPPAFPDFMAIFQESIKLIISENQTLPDFNSPDSQCLQRLDLADFNCRIRSNYSVDLEGVCNPPTTIVAPSTSTSFLPFSSAGIKTTSTTSSRDIMLTSVTSTSTASRKVTTVSTGSVVTSRSEKTTIASAPHPSSSGRTTERSSSMHTSGQFTIPLAENSRLDPQNNGANVLALAIALPIAGVLVIIAIVCFVMIRRRKNFPKEDCSAENPAAPRTDNSHIPPTNESIQVTGSQPVNISQPEPGYFERVYDLTPCSATELWPTGDSSTDDNIFFQGLENRGYTDEEIEKLKTWKSSVNDIFSPVLSMMQTSSPSLYTSGSFRNKTASDSPQRIDSDAIPPDDYKSSGVKSAPKNGAISIPTSPAVSVNLMRFSSTAPGSPGKEVTTPSSSTSSHNEVFAMPSTPQTPQKPTTPGSPRKQHTPQSNLGGPLLLSAIKSRVSKAKRPLQLNITPQTMIRAPAPLTPSSVLPPRSPGTVPITPSALPPYSPAQPPPITTSSPAPPTPANPSSPVPPTPATPSSSAPPPYQEAIRRSRTTSASELSIAKEQEHITPQTLIRAPAPLTPSSVLPPCSPGTDPITPTSLPPYSPAQHPPITTSLPVPPTPATLSSPAPPTPANPSSPVPPTPATPSLPAPPTPATPSLPAPPTPATPSSPAPPTPAPRSLPAPPTPATPSSSVPPPYEEALRRSRTKSASEHSNAKEQDHSKVRNNSNRD